MSPDTPDASPSYAIQGSRFTAPALAPGLYVVATPIGNLRDITLRALETLAAADLVLCEDTRMSARLLDHFAIRAHRASLHEHNEAARIDGLLARLDAGGTLALISDAGTPLLSDPGFPLVRAARAAGHDVFAIPGASALLAALSSAGLPMDGFSFHGFLPQKQGARRTALADLSGRRDTQVFYESPRRLGATLADMAAALGEDRDAAVALELTKRFERFAFGTLSDLATRFVGTATRGEAVILVGGAQKQEPSVDDWSAELADLLEQQPLRAAVDEIASRHGVKRKQVYDAALAIRNRR